MLHCGSCDRSGAAPQPGIDHPGARPAIRSCARGLPSIRQGPRSPDEIFEISSGVSVIELLSQQLQRRQPLNRLMRHPPQRCPFPVHALRQFADMLLDMLKQLLPFLLR